MNIFDSGADVIVHQVNCLGVMGRGLALQIRRRYPRVYACYKTACDMYCPEELLGKIQIVQVSDDLTVVNLFGQLRYGTKSRHTDYDAFRVAVQKINDTFRGKTVAFPYKIGCGLAGGDWNIVERIILENTPDCTVVICKP